MRLYVWLIFLGPVLLVGASVVLLVVGLANDSEGVSTVGAVGIVAGLVISRMKGPFELGASGIKGTLDDELIAEIVRRGLEEGYPPEKVGELVAEALPMQASTTDQGTAVGTDIISNAIEESKRRLARGLAEQQLGRGLLHEREIKGILDRAALENGWTVATNVVTAFGGRRMVADFVVSAGDKKVVVEAVPATPTRFGVKPGFTAQLAKSLEADASLIVIPDGIPPPPSTEEVITIGRLRERLAELLQ